VSKDALVHHLAIPKLYLKRGAIYEMPYFPFSYYPMNIDLIYMLSLKLGSDILPKIFHLFFGVLTAGAIFCYLRQRISPGYALFGFLFFLTIPVVVRLSVTAYVDLGLGFFSILSLLLVLRWSEHRSRVFYLICAGIAAGVAAGIKYNGLITFFLVFLLVIYFCVRDREQNEGYKKAFFNISLFLGISVILLSPWYVRNYIWTGNPIYPLYNSFFNPETAGGSSGIGIFHYRSVAFHESWWDIALVPIRVFFQGQDGSARFFDGKLNPFLLILLPLAYLQATESWPVKREKAAFLWFAVTYLFICFFTSNLKTRYIVPILPPLVILATLGVNNGMRLAESLHNKFLSRCLQISMLGCVIIAFALNLSYIVGQFKRISPFEYILGKVSRDEYVLKYVPEYRVIQFINANLAADSKILFVLIGNRGYYCDRDYMPDMVRNRSLIESLLKEHERPAVIWRELRKRHITHLLININLFRKWAIATLDQEQRARLKRFFLGYAKLLYLDNGYGLYRLR